MTKYGFGKMRSCEQSVCSAGVRRWTDGLLARLRGAAVMMPDERLSKYYRVSKGVPGLRTGGPVPPALAAEPNLGGVSRSWLFLLSESPPKDARLERRASGPDD